MILRLLMRYVENCSLNVNLFDHIESAVAQEGTLIEAIDIWQ